MVFIASLLSLINSKQQKYFLFFCFFIWFFLCILYRFYFCFLFRVFLAVASMFRSCSASGHLVYQKIKYQVLPIWLSWYLCKKMAFLFSGSTVHCVIFHILLETRNITKFKKIEYHLILCKKKNWQKFLTCLSAPKNYVFQLLFFWTDSDFCCKSGLFAFFIWFFLGLTFYF